MTTFVVRVQAGFEAAHHLTAYRGPAEAVHGHSWRVEVALEAEALDGEGMAFDFIEAQESLAALAARLDHRDLNTVPPFDLKSPTSEHLAVWFYEGLSDSLPRACIAEVTIWEAPGCSVTYRPNGVRAGTGIRGRP